MVAKQEGRVVGSGLVFQGAQPADLPRQETGSLHSDITDLSNIEQSTPTATHTLQPAHTMGSREVKEQVR